MEKIKVILVGNPNCGKTTLFNRLTGSDLEVGNWSGVTVKAEKGEFKNENKTFEIIDVPGIYSLNPATKDEISAVEKIIDKDYDLILNIINPFNLERGLELTLSLLKIGKPVAILINMEDEIKKRNLTINIKILSEILNTKVLLFSAEKGMGSDKIISYLTKTDFKFGATYNCQLNPKKIVEQCFKSDNHSFKTNKIDKLLLSSPYSILIFVISFFLLLFLAYGGFSIYLSEKIADLFDYIILYLVKYLSNIGLHNIILSFICEGVLNGISSVCCFIPQLSVIYLGFSLLEQSGYMARISVITDKLFKKLGLNGKISIPLILGLGCTATAIMATRTIEGKNSRYISILILPFVICSAKLPIITMLTTAIFGRYTFLAISFTYFISFLIFALIAKIYSFFLPVITKDSPYIIELPEYHIPDFSVILSLTYKRIKEFLSKVFGILVISNAIIWFLSNFDFELNYVNQFGDSILWILGNKLIFIFKPLGFDRVELVSSLICGIITKEGIVSSLAITDTIVFSSFTSKRVLVSFLIFVILYQPCISSLYMIKKETNSKFIVLFVIVSHFVIAWISSYLYYNLSSFFV